jgi:hypothetical protein
VAEAQQGLLQPRHPLQEQQQRLQEKQQQDVQVIKSGKVDTKVAVQFAGRNEGTQMTHTNNGGAHRQQPVYVCSWLRTLSTGRSPSPPSWLMWAAAALNLRKTCW